MALRALEKPEALREVGGERNEPRLGSEKEKQKEEEKKKKKKRQKENNYYRNEKSIRIGVFSSCSLFFLLHYVAVYLLLLFLLLFCVTHSMLSMRLTVSAPR